MIPARTSRRKTPIGSCAGYFAEASGGQISVTKEPQLREERVFAHVWVGCLLIAAIFVVTFLVLTIAKALVEPHDITANWFAAWGTWAGGLATAEAFLIAAASIAVASAHARVDRQTAADIRADDEMAQARMLTVFRVNIEGAISGLNTFRIENRSKEYFFDVHVPAIEYPNSSGDGIERRTPELVMAENRLHEWLPRGDLLTPHLSTTDAESWFTEVVVHTANWREAKFCVEYTDAAGRRWRQHYGGPVERVLTNEAILVRDADRFQAPYQVRVLSEEEKKREGIFDKGSLTDDDDFLEAVGPALVSTWVRVERVGRPRIRPWPHSDQDLRSVEIGYTPPPPPFWDKYFSDGLQGLSKAGGLNFRSGGGSSVNSVTVRCEESAIPEVISSVDKAIERANNQFEAHELAAARRATEKRTAEAEAKAIEIARLDELSARYERPGNTPWQNARRNQTGQPPSPARQGPSTGLLPHDELFEEEAFDGEVEF